MKPELGLHERYLVVRARDGWSVNLGSDMLNVYTTRLDAREAAAKHCAAAVAAGRSADWVDIGEDHPEGIA
jgi:hypothetical protein